MTIENTGKTKTQTIQTLLSEGKSTREVIDMGFKGGTVYKAQRELRREAKGGYQVTGERSQPDSVVSAQAQSVEVIDLQIENDPEIVRLKKEILSKSTIL